MDKRATGHDGSYAVYVLDCTGPVGDEPWRIGALRTRKTSENEPLTKMERTAAAMTAGERIYYVGQTNGVADRVARHLGGVSYGDGKFTHTFLPQAFVEVRWYTSRETARHREQQQAQELTVPGESFGYWE